VSDLPDPLSPAKIDPERTQRALLKLAEAWPTEIPPIEETLATDRAMAEALLHLLALSPVSTEKLRADPEALGWLFQTARSARSGRQMRASFEMLTERDRSAAFDEEFVTLRRWKRREMLRIALREVGGWSAMEQTTLELTRVAEICVQVAYESWLEELARRWGAPQSEFAVLAMGKFGGEELNYSSDIDVIFFYGEDAHLNPRFTHQEFFGRLAEKIVTTFSTVHPAGTLFRIDLRLRPEGVSGPLVRSLDSIEHYYAAFGETWERMALIKARVVAGSAELGYEFTQRLQPFIFPRSVSIDIMEEIAALKDRIEQEIVGQSSLHRNVKLGYGGIREIEFIVQTLQLLHGARHAFLQERNTLKALRALRQLQILPHSDMESLIDAYRFLRTVEHRLQIENEAQTHTLPDNPEAFARLGRSLGIEGTPAFQAKLASETSAVRAIFERILRSPDQTARAPALDLSFFAEPQRARRLIGDLDGSAASARFSVRTRKLAQKVEPLLLDWLRRVADPDTALTAFVRFVERYGARGLLFETLLRNPKLMELLVRLFDASRFLTEIAVRRPQLIEEIARAGGLGDLRIVADYLRSLESNDENVAWQEWLRIHRRAQLLRIGLRDVLGLATLRELQSEFTALAEASLIFAQQRLGLANELTIVAMGKFGGRELTYGADLDVVFLGEDNAAAGEIIRTMTQASPEGAVFAIDARLRPEGEAGPLSCSLRAYEEYFARRAQTWEAQALTKARPIAGPQQDEYQAVAQRAWSKTGKTADLSMRIKAMHERIVHERAGHNDFPAFKTGHGGLMALEFYTQALQMRHELWETNTLDALGQLAARGALSSENVARASASYEFLRRLEAVLRRVDDKPVSVLPLDPTVQRQLAVRCGEPDPEAFLARYRDARATIREICEWPPP
jgi:glutamate-ammonia-ligase adenylyltransferase